MPRSDHLREASDRCKELPWSSRNGLHESPERRRFVVRGAVQGVGFRPHVYRLADELGLSGWVGNDSEGVHIEVEGAPATLKTFLLRLERERPPAAQIESIESATMEKLGEVGFHIRPSDTDGPRATWIQPDLATCADCLRELFDPTDRRYRYPFLNCTHCGPRFSIVLSLPYDRVNTTMRRFPLCEECSREYQDPRDRRFHAQPIACPRCGPHLELWDRRGRIVVSGDAVVQAAAEAIRNGAIVALKGLGGFQLLADASAEDSIQRLRARKRREAKPFALMYPSLESIARDTQLSSTEARLLSSSQAPIVLLRRCVDNSIAPAVAPGNPYLGVMLPYTPPHHLLMTELGFPIVATSGNLSDEPICIDEREVLERLGNIADLFVVHDRPIARHMDDSVGRVIMGEEQVLRRARGYAPLPISVAEPLPSILAVGAHLKNAVALSLGRHVFLSQHIGDLETTEAHTAFQEVCHDLPTLYQTRPSAVACDLHPDYLSTQFAEQTGLPIVRVQHHVAHSLSCLAENHVSGPVLGVAWDGTGYGEDGVVWGGEFFHVSKHAVRRVAHLYPFPLPGGEAAVREPRRAAVGLLHAMGEDETASSPHPIWNEFSAAEQQVVRLALRRKLNTPLTTSAGRLFDAVAALAGVRSINRFEGEAAMEWEWLADEANTTESYPINLQCRQGQPAILDWWPMVRALLADIEAKVPAQIMSARFHNGLGEGIVAVCRMVGERQVALSGGCFVNRRLLEGVVRRLTQEGHTVWWHQQVPPGDGGIALGQIMAAAKG